VGKERNDAGNQFRGGRENTESLSVRRKWTNKSGRGRIQIVVVPDKRSMKRPSAHEPENEGHLRILVRESQRVGSPSLTNRYGERTGNIDPATVDRALA